MMEDAFDDLVRKLAEGCDPDLIKVAVTIQHIGLDHAIHIGFGALSRLSGK